MNIVAILIGAIIAWLTSRYYYTRADKDMEREASELIQQINLTLLGMEEGKLVKRTKDEQGNVDSILRKSSGLLK